MAEQSDELKKLVAVTTDYGLSSELRTQAIKLIGSMRNHEALVALLELVANERLTKKERELALKQAGEILKSIRQ